MSMHWTQKSLSSLRLLNSLLFQFQLNDYEIRKGKKIGVTISFNNHRLFVGNIPKNRDRDELLEEFAKYARKSKTKPLQINNYYYHQPTPIC